MEALTGTGVQELCDVKFCDGSSRNVFKTFGVKGPQGELLLVCDERIRHMIVFKNPKKY